MVVTIKEQTKRQVDVSWSFPIYRSRLTGDYGIAGYEKTYWKFDSIHKVTVITERMCETSILTYNDKNADFFVSMVDEDMLLGEGSYDIIPEKLWNNAVDRLVSKVSQGI